MAQLAEQGSAHPADDVHEVEAWLVSRIVSKGLHHLALDEVATAHRSKVFPDVWHRLTGTPMPDNIKSQMAERLNRAGKGGQSSKIGSIQSTGAMASRETNSTSFLKAVAAGDVEVVRSGLEGKDRRKFMESLDEQQRSAAHLAARGGHAEVLVLLHDHGSDIEGSDKFGRSPLHLACEHGRTQSVEQLMQLGCQIVAEDRSGRTPLHLAACSEDPKISSMLISRHNQLVGALDRHCRTPLFYSVLNVHAHAQSEVTRILLEHLAEVNARDSYGMAPLHYASEEGRKPAVVLLLKHLADPSLEDTVHGRNAMQLASSDAIRRELRKAGGNLQSGGAGEFAPPQAAEQPMPPALKQGSGSRAQSAGPSGARIGGASLQQVLPQALGAPFQALQERFVTIMTRVQEGGIQQMEHVKQPQLFTGSWMAHVSSHQQLLSETFRNVPGPEVCMRVFNLLRPPERFPVSRGDEKDIIAYYAHHDAVEKAWGGSNPYAVANAEDDSGLEDAGLSNARRVELLRAVHDSRRELVSKEAMVEELRRKVEKQRVELEDCGGRDGEFRKLRSEAVEQHSRLRSEEEALQDAETKNRIFEGKERVLAEQCRSELERGSRLEADRDALKRRLEAMLSQQGQEQSWKLVLDDKSREWEAARVGFQQQIGAYEAGRDAGLRELEVLRAELQRFRAEAEARERAVLMDAEGKVDRHQRDSVESMAEAARLRHDLGGLSEHRQQLQNELHAAAAEAQEGRVYAGQLRRHAEELDKAETSVERLEAENDRLKREHEEQDVYWKMMFNKYPLVGQMLFGAGT